MRIVLAFACSETSAAWMVAEMAEKNKELISLGEFKKLKLKQIFKNFLSIVFQNFSQLKVSFLLIKKTDKNV